jgi:hypothetical protein
MLAYNEAIETKTTLSNQCIGQARTATTIQAMERERWNQTFLRPIAVLRCMVGSPGPG